MKNNWRFTYKYYIIIFSIYSVDIIWLTALQEIACFIINSRMCRGKERIDGNDCYCVVLLIPVFLSSRFNCKIQTWNNFSCFWIAVQAALPVSQVLIRGLSRYDIDSHTQRYDICRFLNFYDTIRYRSISIDISILWYYIPILINHLHFY